MTDKEKISAIKAEIERRMQECKDSKIESSYYDGLIFAFEEVRDFIDSLPEEPVSEDLESKIDELSKRYPEVSFAKLTRIAVGVAKWQKELMMKNAIEATVKVDAGGYPYIHRTIELYDYDKDEPVAKKGDKVKIIIIKDK